MPGLSDVLYMFRLCSAVLLLAVALSGSSAREVPGGTTVARVSPTTLRVTPDEGFRIRSVVQEVKLSFTVTDSLGRPKLDLQKGDFRILDQQRPAEQIQSFALERDLPLRVVFLVDGSASLASWLRVQNAGVEEFLRHMRPGTDAATAVVFADAAQFDQRFGGSGSDLIQNVDIRSSVNLTSLFDVLHRACSAVARIRESGQVRRSLIVISDGEDNASMYGLDQVIEVAQKYEISIYAIAMGRRSSHGSQVLAALSHETGGQSYFPRTPPELQDALTAIEAELRTRYSITYTPPGPMFPGSYHPVRLSLPGHQQLSIKVRAGYYVPNGN